MIGLVTAAVSRELDEDLQLLGAALERAGTQFHFVEWHDTSVDWSQYSSIVLRSPWDYHLRRDEFLTWLRAAALVTNVHNPYDVVEWNSDKRYLGELITAGIAVVPTVFVSGDDDVAARVRDIAGKDVVVKPSISAGSHDTVRYRDATRDATLIIEHVKRIAANGATAMVQEYQSHIDVSGETGMVYFYGVFSHAFRKGAILQHDPDMSNGLYATEDIGPREPSVAELALGEKLLNFVKQRFGSMPTYARVDVIPDAAGVPQLMELELVEPSFFLWVSEEAADTAALAISVSRGSLNP